ncbi:MAG: class I SAM-dependent methyltransferase [Pseudomonadota bacterium]
MQQPSPNALYDDPELAQFYDARGAARPDFDYCRTLARDAASVLDLGCGTGELAASLAAGRAVTGIDPAGAMIDIAHERAGGDKVTWVEADARTVRLGKRFDLVMLTGHSFQVFLTSDDQAAVLATIAAHLAPGGRFIFDTRNPAYPARKTRSADETRRQFRHPRLGTVEAWNESTYDDETGVLSYENAYRVLDTGDVFSATAQIRYTPLPDLADMVTDAGLAVEDWLGDWTGRQFQPTSPEIIPLGRLA